MTPVELHLRRDRVRAFLVAAVVSLTVVGAGAHLIARGADGGLRQSVTRPLLLDAELTLPAWFSSVLLLAIAAASWWLGSAGAEHRVRWRVLAAVFVALSLDEAIILHELFDQMLADLLGRDGGEALWVYPAAIAVLAVGVYVLPLFRAQPPGDRRLWIAALAAYGGGAVGVEFISRPYFDVPSQASVGYLALVTLEEGLEMVGASLFLLALLAAVARDVPRTTVAVHDGPAA